MIRVDETDLLLPLHEGLREPRPWRTFLARLRRRVRADTAVMLLGMSPPGGASDDVMTVEGSADDVATFRTALGTAWLNLLRRERVYSNAELGEFLPGFAGSRGHARLVRVGLSGEGGACLAVLRREADFEAADGALLSRLAPHLSVAFATFVALGLAQRDVETADAALERTRIGWLLLDDEARLLAISPLATVVLDLRGGRAPVTGRRLSLPGPHADAALQAAATRFASDSGLPPEILRLGPAPRHMLLAVPAAATIRGIVSRPALLGLVRLAEPQGDPHRAAPIAHALGLTAGEARVADAIACGSSIADAATHAGLTIETARHYTRRIYAKTGTRGQADLVRLVLDSVAALG